MEVELEENCILFLLNFHCYNNIFLAMLNQILIHEHLPNESPNHCLDLYFFCFVILIKNPFFEFTKSRFLMTKLKEYLQHFEFFDQKKIYILYKDNCLLTISNETKKIYGVI